MAGFGAFARRGGRRSEDEGGGGEEEEPAAQRRGRLLQEEAQRNQRRRRREEGECGRLLRQPLDGAAPNSDPDPIQATLFLFGSPLPPPPHSGQYPIQSSASSLSVTRAPRPSLAPPWPMQHFARSSSYSYQLSPQLSSSPHWPAGCCLIISPPSSAPSSVPAASQPPLTPGCWLSTSRCRCVPARHPPPPPLRLFALPPSRLPPAFHLTQPRSQGNLRRDPPPQPAPSIPATDCP